MKVKTNFNIYLNHVSMKKKNAKCFNLNLFYKNLYYKPNE